jgi:hypothetical protein
MASASVRESYLNHLGHRSPKTPHPKKKSYLKIPLLQAFKPILSIPNFRRQLFPIYPPNAII